MNQEKRKRALALFEQPVDSENIAPYRNKAFHTTMAQDSLANLDIDLDYENYEVIASGGDIIIYPDDEDQPVIVDPTQLKAAWVSYVSPSGVNATNVQIALDKLYTWIAEYQSVSAIVRDGVMYLLSEAHGDIDPQPDPTPTPSSVTYASLPDKPQINGVTLIGNMNGHTLNLLNENEYEGQGGRMGPNEINPNTDERQNNGPIDGIGLSNLLTP